MEPFVISTVAEDTQPELLHVVVQAQQPGADITEYLAALDEYAATQGQVPAGRPFWRAAPGRENALEIAISLLPQVTLPAYKGRKAVYHVPAVTPEEVEGQLTGLRQSCAAYKPLEEGAPASGDRVTLNYDAVCDNGLRFSESMCRGGTFTVGDGQLPAAFWQAVCAVPAGQKFSCTVTLPRTFPDRRAAGRNATYTGTVLKAERPVLPPADDAFAGRFGMANIEALREDLRARLCARMEAMARKVAADRAVKAICAEAELEVPVQAVEAELNWQWGRLEHRLQSSGILLEQHLGRLRKTEEELRRDMRAHAALEVRDRFVLLAIARAEGLLARCDEAVPPRRPMGPGMGPVDRMQLRQRISAQRAMEAVTAGLDYVRAESE